MIQLNLLPDVKQEYIKTKRNRRMIMVVSSLVMAGSLGVLTLLVLTANVYQNRSISSLDEEIVDKLETVQGREDLSKILTIQNQLDALPGLHNDKAASTRTFSYLQRIVPVGVKISALEIDFDDSTIELSGTAETLSRINTFVDTIKFTQYDLTLNDPDRAEDFEPELVNAFSNVVLVGTESSGGTKTYRIDADFAEDIFKTDEPFVGLVVPTGTTTRSEIEQPGALFQFDPQVDGSGGSR